MKPRVYTLRDPDVDRALELASEVGLVPSEASLSQRLRALTLYAEERLTAEADLQRRIAAYDELAADQERSVAVEASVLAAVDDGIL